MSDRVGDTFAFLMAFAVVAMTALAGVGWVMNVAKIFLTLADPITGMFLMRCIGVVLVPIGCIVGWL